VRLKSNQNQTFTIMSVIILSHDVKDFEAWKPYYYADAPRRERLGLKDLAVGNASDEPTKVYIIWDGDSASVEQMLQDPELPELMKEAGVVSDPEITVLNA
jgi:hypothetical protein